MAIAVEGKASEPFGDETVGEWRSESPNKIGRLQHLLAVLELQDVPEIDG